MAAAMSRGSPSAALAWRVVQVLGGALLFKDYVAEAALCAGESMLPTLRSRGDVLLVEKISVPYGRLRRGDVVVCVSPSDPNKLICKRVVGLEHDAVAVQRGGFFPTHHHIPKGHVWLEGDNGARSHDSRDFGPVPYGLLRGRALCKARPPLPTAASPADLATVRAWQDARGPASHQPINRPADLRAAAAPSRSPCRSARCSGGTGGRDADWPPRPPAAAMLTTHTSVPPVFRAQPSVHGARSVVLRLLVAQETHPVRTLQLPANIGRAFDQRVSPSARNGLFESCYLSRHHAIIKTEKGRVVVEDLGSCNGTFVNGLPVRPGESWPLADGDLLQFGSEDDAAENASIVAQVCIEGSPAKPPADTDDPFVVQHAAAGADAGVIVAKIAAVSRSLAALGVLVRTRAPAPANTLSLLASMEALLQHTQHDDPSSLFPLLPTPSLPSSLLSPPSIHQQPSLAAAMRIIHVYEAAFCLAAFLLASHILLLVR